MKKSFLVAVLGVLCLLLYVTSLAVRKQTDPELPAGVHKDAPPQSSGGSEPGMKPVPKLGNSDNPPTPMISKVKTQAEAEKLYRSKMMKNKPKPNPDQMQLGPNWFNDRKDGEAGAQEEIEKRKAAKAAAAISAREDAAKAAATKSITGEKKPEDPNSAAPGK